MVELSSDYESPAQMKRRLLHKMRCSTCGAEGVELTALVMHRIRPARTTVHSLICVPCNRIIRTGGKPELKDQYPKEWEALGGRGLHYETTVRIRLNNL